MTTQTRRGLWLLLATGAVVVLLAVGAGFYVFQKHQWAQAQLAALEPRYARLAGLRLSEPELDQISTANRARLAQYVYPASQDASQAGNDAQQRIRAVLGAAGLDVMSSQVLPSKKDPMFDRIPLSVRIEGDLLGLQSMLVVLPSLLPVVLIDSLNVQTVGQVRGDRRQRLAIQINLSVLRARAS